MSYCHNVSFKIKCCPSVERTTFISHLWNVTPRLQRFINFPHILSQKRLKYIVQNLVHVCTLYVSVSNNSNILQNSLVKDLFLCSNRPSWKQRTSVIIYLNNAIICNIWDCRDVCGRYSAIPAVYCQFLHYITSHSPYNNIKRMTYNQLS